MSAVKFKMKICIVVQSDPQPLFGAGSTTQHVGNALGGTGKKLYLKAVFEQHQCKENKRRIPASSYSKSQKID